MIKYFKLAAINIFLVTLVGILFVSIVNYINGNSFDYYNILFIVLIIPILTYLINDLKVRYKKLEEKT